MIDARRFDFLDYAVMVLSVMVVAMSAGCEDGIADADAVSGDSLDENPDVLIDVAGVDANGTCGSCSGGTFCVDDRCVCIGGQKSCGGICTTLGTNDNCFDCGDLCTGGKTCRDNQCTADIDTECLPTVPCVNDVDCANGSRCNLAIDPPACQRLYCGSLGTACSEDYFCLSRLCSDDVCIDEVIAPTCGNLDFNACGGDVVGDWKIESYCEQPRSAAAKGATLYDVPDCRDGNSAVTAEVTNWSGIHTFDATAHYSFDEDYTIQVKEVLFDACLDAIGGGGVDADKVCEYMLAQLRESIPDATSTYSGGKCTVTGSTDVNDGEVSTGTYFTNGSRIHLDDDGVGFEYCVDSGYMYVQLVDDVDTDRDDDVDETYKDVLVLKKQ